MKNIVKIAAFLLTFVNLAQAATPSVNPVFCAPNRTVTLKALTAMPGKTLTAQVLNDMDINAE